MNTIIRRILMIEDRVKDCPYWEKGKCTAVDYSHPCNFRQGFVRCQVYLEKRVNE